MSQAPSAMTAKHLAFVREFLVDANGTAAAVRAGYSARSAGQQSSQLLKDPHVQAELRSRMSSLLQRAEVTAERVLVEFARIAFLDPREVMTWTDKGITLVDSDKLTADQANAVRRVKQTTTKHYDRAGTVLNETNVVEVELHDKQSALRSLGQFAGMFPRGGGGQNPLAGAPNSGELPEDPTLLLVRGMQPSEGFSLAEFERPLVADDGG